MGLLKAVRLDSTLAHLASARLLGGRCDRVLGLRCAVRTLWWLPKLPRWDSEPPLDTTSSSSESASWCRARRRAVGRGTWGTRHQEASGRLPPSLTARPPVRGAPRGRKGSHPASVFSGERNRDQARRPPVHVTRLSDADAKSPTRERSPLPVPLAAAWRHPRFGGEWPARKCEACTQDRRRLVLCQEPGVSLPRAIAGLPAACNRAAVGPGILSSVLTSLGGEGRSRGHRGLGSVSPGCEVAEGHGFQGQVRYVCAQCPSEVVKGQAVQ